MGRYLLCATALVLLLSWITQVASQSGSYILLYTYVHKESKQGRERLTHLATDGCTTLWVYIVKFTCSHCINGGSDAQVDGGNVMNSC